MSVNASIEYISASINRFNHAASSSSSSLVAYGSGKFVALWDPEDPSDHGVLETLVGHSGLVTCVEFIDDAHLASADDTGMVRIWKLNSDGKWTSVLSVQAHSKAVSALCANLQAGYLVTGASDSTVKVWDHSTKDELQEVQSIALNGRYPLSLELANLPQSKALVLAIAGTDKSIYIYLRSEEKFVYSATLSGHEDWIRSLSFRPPLNPTDPLILASGSQDATIRLWNIDPVTNFSSNTDSTTDALSDELLDAFEASLGELSDAGDGGRQISLKKHVLTVKGDDVSRQKFSVTFDALLVGHEAGITALAWRLPQNTTPSSQESQLTLLSTSSDSSVIIWSPSPIVTAHPDASSAIWVNRQRFGDVGGQRLGGFVGGLWACSGRDILAWGWAGGWRRWHCEASDEDSAETWAETGAISGHAGPVRGIAWSPGGEYLISVGLDQTTRIHAALPTVTRDSTHLHSWHELSRPQVHGYDLVSVGFIDSMRFVSVADEKVARVFEAPGAFVRSVKNLGVADPEVSEEGRPVTASVPPLGLSNKAITDGNAQLPTANSAEMTRRPFEGELAAMTLWPETEKVFGHGYESVTVSVSSSHKFIATACKATTPKHAVVRIYDTEKFRPIGEPLAGHALTVTRIAFSPDDRHILTVSRDRTWRLFRLQAKGGGYIPIAADKSHLRIIWDCAWALEGDLFATASRDKTVKIWCPKDQSEDQWTAVATLKLPEAATAVAFTINQDKQILAIGLETGEILIYSSSSPLDWKHVLSIKAEQAHTDHIHQLAWGINKETQRKHLASCSEDGTLRILAIQFGIN